MTERSSAEHFMYIMFLLTPFLAILGFHIVRYCIIVRMQKRNMDDEYATKEHNNYAYDDADDDDDVEQHKQQEYQQQSLERDRCYRTNKQCCVSSSLSSTAIHFKDLSDNSSTSDETSSDNLVEDTENHSNDDDDEDDENAVTIPTHNVTTLPSSHSAMI